MNTRKAAIILFIVLFLAGLYLSSRKPLWTDEIHTQVKTVERVSPLGIVGFASFPEGNRCPLFYLIQKAWTGLCRYEFPVPLDQSWSVYHPYSQIILRIPVNLLMSLGMVLLFVHFSRRLSPGFGFLALLIALSMPMVWLHWAEARPYALWFCLTVWQWTTFDRLARYPGETKSWRIMTVVHFLLALTIIFSLIQIVVFSLGLYFVSRKEWKRISLAGVIPAGITVFYFLSARGLHAWKRDALTSSAGPGTFLTVYANNIKQVLFSFPIESILILLLWALLIFFVPFKDGKQKAVEQLKAGIVILMLISGFAFLGIFVRTSELTYLVPERYFIYLTPFAVIAAVHALKAAVDIMSRDKWLMINGIIAVTGLILLSYVRTFLHVYSTGIY